MAIDKLNFWGSNYYNHPALTDEMVAHAEKALKCKLPARLIEMLKIQNGGYTLGFVFPMKEKTTWADNYVPFSDLFGIDISETLTGDNILASEYLMEEWGLPEKQVLLSGDGHWWITLDYRHSDIPTVRWIDTECDQDIHIANSFDEFLDGLISEDDFGEED